MKNACLAFLAFAVLSSNAHAGKEERDYLKNKLTPAIKEAEAKFKESCGCALKIVLNDGSTKEYPDLEGAKGQAQTITDGVKGYCVDAESKKALCKMKTLEIRKGNQGEFTFKGDKGVVFHDGSGYTAFEAITRELDK